MFENCKILWQNFSEARINKCSVRNALSIFLVFPLNSLHSSKVNKGRRSYTNVSVVNSVQWYLQPSDLYNQYERKLNDEHLYFTCTYRDSRRFSHGRRRGIRRKYPSPSQGLATGSDMRRGHNACRADRSVWKLAGNGSR